MQNYAAVRQMWQENGERVAEEWAGEILAAEELDSQAGGRRKGRAMAIARLLWPAEPVSPDFDLQSLHAAVYGFISSSSSSSSSSRQYWPQRT